MAVLAAILILGVIWRTGVAFLRCRLGILPSVWRKNLSSANEQEKIILCFSFLVVICCILLAFNPNSGIYVRYALFLIPPIAVLIGAFISETLNRLELRPVTAFAVAGIFSTLFVLHGYIEAVNRFRHFNPVSELTDLIDGLRVKAGFSDHDLSNKVLLINAKGKIVFTQAGYLINISSKSAPVPGDIRCTIAVNAVEKQNALSLISKAFATQKIDPPFFTRIFEAGGQLIFSYSLPDGNCYTSLLNAYDRSVVESQIHDSCNVSAPDGLVSAVDGTKSFSKKYIIRHTFQPTRLCLGLNLDIVNEQLVTSLISSHLRGYTGYPISQYRLTGAQLKFKNGKENTLKINLLDVSIGG